MEVSPVSRIEYLSHLGQDGLRWLSGLTQSVSGWLAGAITGFLPNPVTAIALLILWVLDLFSGSALAVRQGKFSLRRWPLSLLKLFLWLSLAIMCSVLRAQANTLGFAAGATAALCCGVLEFALVSFEGASVLRNVAQFSGIRWMLQVSRFWDRSLQRALDRIAPEDPGDSK
jgi:hypothetical protein